MASHESSAMPPEGFPIVFALIVTSPMLSLDPVDPVAAYCAGATADGSTGEVCA
jgi:hypothetical protein